MKDLQPTSTKCTLLLCLNRNKVYFQKEQTKHLKQRYRRHLRLVYDFVHKIGDTEKVHGIKTL